MPKKIITVTEAALPFLREAKALLSDEDDLPSKIEGLLTSMQHRRTLKHLDVWMLKEWFSMLYESVDSEEALQLLVKAECALNWFENKNRPTTLTK